MAVAPKREMILDFHPKDSIASEQLNEKQGLQNFAGDIQTPKTA